MNKQLFTLKNIILFAFIAVEAGIYIAFNVISATRAFDPIYLKYSGVLLCLAFAALEVYFCGGDRDAWLIFAAMVTTAISDLFILVLDDYYEIGLVTFIITQSVYLYRLYADRLKKIWITLVVRAALAVGAIIAVAVTAGANLLIIECAIYIAMLASNFVDAAILAVLKRSVRHVLFAVGLLLFICCDICVGLHNFDMLGVDLSAAVRHFVGFAIWAFYLPSQVMIVCSVKRGGL